MPCKSNALVCAWWNAHRLSRASTLSKQSCVPRVLHAANGIGKNNQSFRVRPKCSLGSRLLYTSFTRSAQLRGFVQLLHQSSREPKHVNFKTTAKRRFGNTTPSYQVSAHETSDDDDIRVVDISAEGVQQFDLTPTSLDEFLTDNSRGRPNSTRWIFVNGLNYNAIQTLGRHKGLHRLAIEDVLNSENRTKVDWYDDHCFIVLNLQTLANEETSEILERGSSADRFDKLSLYRLHSLQHDLASPDDDQLATPALRPTARSKHNPNVFTEQVSIFLTADNTVISIFENQGTQVFESVMHRAKASGTVLRSGNDPSMLVYALLDSVVDLSIPVIKSYDAAIRSLELSVLLDPKTTQPREVYALRSELAQLESITKPINGLINILREHERTSPSYPTSSDQGSQINNPPSPQPASSRKLISPLARTYLADVQDQVIVLIDKLHTSTRTTEDLTSLIFNLITVRQNESIKQLTLVTILFLPLTFLTGYFGMNFETFEAVKNNSDAYFWYLATPMVGITALFFVISGVRARNLYRGMRRRLSWRRKRK